MLKNISIIYGSTTGNTADLANIISLKLQNPKFNIQVQNAKDINKTYQIKADLNIWCCSTWGIEPACLQDDFECFINTKLDLNTIKNQNFAIFAIGDSYYPHFAYASNILEDFISKNEGNCVVRSLKLQDPFELEMKKINENLLNIMRWLL
jgi:flavodoxin I